MKYIIILSFSALVCFTESIFGQTRLNGDIRKLGDSNVIFQYYEGNTAKTVTIKAIDGKFTWEAPIAETQKITIIFPGRATWIFVEPGNMTIKGTRDSVETLRVTGSETNDEAVAYAEVVKPLLEEEKPLFLQYGKLPDEKELELEEKLGDIAKQKRTIINNYIAAHKGSSFSLNLVTEYSRLGVYEDVVKMYDGLSKKMQSTSEGKRIASRLAILKRSAVGEKVIAFTQKDNNGNPVSISAFKGKYVFIDFWASWCAPCRGEIPNLIKAYDIYKGNNFTVVSISLDDHANLWQNAIAALKMPWTQLSDLKGWDNELSVYYGLKGIPSTLLIDPNGNIIAKDLRGVMLNKKLKELFDHNSKN